MFYLSLNNNSLSCHPASDSDSDSGSDSDKANLKTPIPASVPIKLLPLHPWYVPRCTHTLTLLLRYGHANAFMLHVAKL